MSPTYEFGLAKIWTLKYLVQKLKYKTVWFQFHRLFVTISHHFLQPQLYTPTGTVATGQAAKKVKTVPNLALLFFFIFFFLQHVQADEIATVTGHTKPF